MTGKKLSYHDYAAIVCSPDDSEGSWFWCQVSEAGKFSKDEDFYATVLNGQWQIKVMPKIKTVMVMQTGQMIPNTRLAYFGQVPVEFSGTGYDVIHTHLMKTEYVKWPGFSDPGY
jgi:hypothetical protein